MSASVSCLLALPLAEPPELISLRPAHSATSVTVCRREAAPPGDEAAPVRDRGRRAKRGGIHHSPAAKFGMFACKVWDVRLASSHPAAAEMPRKLIRVSRIKKSQKTKFIKKCLQVNVGYGHCYDLKSFFGCGEICGTQYFGTRRYAEYDVDQSPDLSKRHPHPQRPT